jgi:hypothetical protein
LPGNNPADRRFAGSHEAHKGQVMDLPVTNHDSVLAPLGAKFKVQTSRAPPPGPRARLCSAPQRTDVFPGRARVLASLKAQRGRRY